MNPQYPIYIVSKGRWQEDRRLTVKALDAMWVPYTVICEADEYADYRSAILPSNPVIILPQHYKTDYDCCDALGLTKSTGPGPARNYALDHSIEAGAKRHWVLDDNIRSFERLNRNYMHQVTSGTIFKCMEDFADRFTNVYIAGPHYCSFVLAKLLHKPFCLNTRVYSCLLIQNNIPFRWRGRYNEDTDICLRVVKAGHCIVQFNGFLQMKAVTQKVKGGNTADFYDIEGTRPKSQMLVDLHPDVAKHKFKHMRDHHQVDYKSFRNNRLILAPGVVIPTGVNNYGMQLVVKP